MSRGETFGDQPYEHAERLETQLVSPVELPMVFQIVSGIFLTAILTFDLLLILRRPHTPTLREATSWVVVYVLLALMFAGAMFVVGDARHATEFLAGWLTEYSLSIDNLFVFVLILTNFHVPHAYQQRALMIGIVLALMFRGVFILAGAAIIERFITIFIVFGGWLIWTAWQQVKPGEESSEGESWVVRQVKKVLPVTDDYDGGRLRTTVNGNQRWTPFLLVFVSLGVTDLLFALDSIPAIFGITQHPFIVFTANVFALMGLRQLYFLLGALLDKLVYLKYGIAAILAFIGVKLILHALHSNEFAWINGGHPVPVVEIGTGVSLGFIVCSMTAATVASIVRMRRDAGILGKQVRLGAREGDDDDD